MSRSTWATSLCARPLPKVCVVDERGDLHACHVLAYDEVGGDEPFFRRVHQDRLDELCAPTQSLSRRARVLGTFLDLELVALTPVPVAVHLYAGKDGAPPPYRPTLAADLAALAVQASASFAAQTAVQAARRVAFARLNVAAKNMLGARLVLAGALTPMWGWSGEFDDLMAHRDLDRR